MSYKAVVNNDKYTAKIAVNNIVTSCLDATVTALNSDGDTVGTATAPSGGTGTINVANSEITKANGQSIINLPATNSYAVPSSVISLQDSQGTPISTTTVQATDNATITAPNGTVTIRNNANTVIKTASVTSGGTTTATITDSAIRRSDATLIANVAAEQPYTVADTPVTLQDSASSLISVTNVLAASTGTITAPNGTSNLTDQYGNSLGSVSVRSNATQSDSITVPCSHLRSRLDRYKTGGFASLGSFGTLVANARAVAVNGDFIYLTNNNNLEKHNRTTFANVATIMGFTLASELAFSPDGTQYAVVNTNANTVRIMATSTDTQSASWASVTSPFSITYNQAGTELLVAPFVSSTITRYNLAGVSQGTVTGFDANIIEIRGVGANYYVLTATGTSGASTQRVRVMDFATNTQQASYSLGTVTSIGDVRSMVIEGNRVYITAAKSNVLFLYEYDLTFNLLRSENLGLNGTSSYGLAYNSYECGSLVIPQPIVGQAINVLL